MRNDFTDKELLAVSLYMSGMTKTGALRAAGYCKDTVQWKISTWWKREKIVTEIQKRRKKVAKKSEVTTLWLTERLKAIVELDVGTLVDQEGNLLPMDHLPLGLRQALTVKIVDGKIKEITMSDRLKAMDQLARLGGLYEDKINVSGEIELKDRLLAGRKRAALRNKEDDDDS